MARSKQPTVAYGLLADSHSEADRGKIDVFGVFTSMKIWATPANRECSLVIGLRNVPESQFVISIWFRSEGDKAEKLGAVEADSGSTEFAKTVAFRVPLPLSGIGRHELGVTIGESVRGGVFWIPLRVIQRDWPQLPTGEELQDALDDPNVIDSVRAVIECDDCGKEYIFQKNLDPNASIDPPAEPFPEDGVLKCSECGSVHHVKDIEGQVTAQLGTAAQGGDE